MTTINGGFGAANLFQANLQRGMDAASFVLAAGIMGQRMNPLGASPFAFASLPPAFNLWCGCPAIPQAPQWSATVANNGTAKIDLGDGYTLEVNEKNSEMTILNASTGERTRIWGDPHVEIDGKHAFDFWGTTTFTLENGTKITINTEQWRGNPNEYVASKVTITNGERAMVIDGISQNKLGDLKVTMGGNGYALDAATRDGYTLHENASGKGWRTELGNIATQKDLNATRVGAEYGPGSQALSLAEAGEALSGFFLLGTLNSLFALSALSFGAGATGRGEEAGDRRGGDVHLHVHQHNHVHLV